MIAFCFYIPRRYQCGKQIRLERWELAAKSFEVDLLIAIDRTGFECLSIEQPAGEPSVIVVRHITEVYEAYPNASRVFVEKDAPSGVIPTDLYEYQHPAGDVVYFIGDDGSGFVGDTSDGDWVVVPTLSKYGLWAEQAGLIVMADRCRRDDN